MPVCLSVCPPVCLSVSLSLCMSACLPALLLAGLSIGNNDNRQTSACFHIRYLVTVTRWQSEFRIRSLFVTIMYQ
jgi:hypothetical protein